MIYSASINRVIDGDTVVARLDMGLGIESIQHVRLSGINTPELNAEAGKQARDWLKDRLLFRKVKLAVDDQQTHDKYGRLLGVLWLEEVNINQELIRQGYAVEYHGGKRPAAPWPTPTPG